jgi:hypothetical protein
LTQSGPKPGSRSNSNLVIHHIPVSVYSDNHPDAKVLILGHTGRHDPVSGIDIVCAPGKGLHFNIGIDLADNSSHSASAPAASPLATSLLIAEIASLTRFFSSSVRVQVSRMTFTGKPEAASSTAMICRAGF